MIDGEFYRGHARADCRSHMNVTFRLPSEELEKSFVKDAEQHQLFELKGHRSVGGIRASIYNAMPLEGVQTLRFLHAGLPLQQGIISTNRSGALCRTNPLNPRTTPRY